MVAIHVHRKDIHVHAYPVETFVCEDAKFKLYRVAFECYVLAFLKTFSIFLFTNQSIQFAFPVVLLDLLYIHYLAFTWFEYHVFNRFVPILVLSHCTVSRSACMEEICIFNRI